MKLYVIFAQRKCSYADQYAPEALAVLDQYAYDENPSWLQSQLEHHKGNPDFAAVDLFAIYLGTAGGEAIWKHLNQLPELSATVEPVKVEKADE